MFADSNILLPTDFSPYALHAMKYAVAIAKQYGGTVHVAHVLDTSVEVRPPGHGLWLTKSEAEALLASMREHAESRLANVVERAAEAGVATAQHIVAGLPGPEILKLARDQRCTMIVVATHGRSGFDHMVFGSVAEKVVRQSPVPVLCIKHPEHEFVNENDLSLDLKRILFPTDFSAFSQRALPFALSLCREFGASLVLFHASEVPVLLPEFMPDSAMSLAPEMEAGAKKTLDRIRAGIEGIDVETYTVTGVPYREICHHVDASHVDLVVMPTHGRSGLSHMLFGSVAEKVVRLARCPVFTIRPEWEGPEPF